MVSDAAEKTVPEAPSPSASDPPKNEDGHVSISRRGLTAAGLAVAVVGSMGVAWTMTAGADEVPEPPAPVAAAVTEESTPPPVLPWGSRPQEMTVAKAGASSATVAAVGADGARADSSGETVAEPEFSPKGYTSENGTLTSTETNVTPPRPPSGKVLAEPANNKDNPVKFFYATANQYAEADGTYANLVIGRPWLSRDDYHTLAEIAVQSEDGKQIVEVGWNVDRSVNGDDDPHLFVYHWVNKKESCYNGCGFVQFSRTLKPGDTLPAGTSKRFGVQFFNDAWWIAYDSEWIGYFPSDLWGGKFERSGFIQWFGEVASSSDRPCTDMGTGSYSSAASAARVGSISLINGPAEDLYTTVTDSDYYSVNRLSERTMRYGGAGPC